MLYQLQNGKVIYLSIEEFLDLTDEDIQYLMALNAGDYITDPFSGSAMKKNTKKKRYDFDSEDIEDNISEYNRLKKAEKELSNFVASRYPTQYKKAKANEDSFWDYHLVLDIVAVVLYVAGALTIQFYGLGLVLELLAIFVELFNAWSYVGLDDDPDYFMAGLTASFTIFPAGNLIFKTVFRGFTKSMQYRTWDTNHIPNRSKEIRSP
mgnify:CR=1 FL=1